MQTYNSEQMYMNTKTGSTGTYDEWYYEDADCCPVNAVDLREVIPVVNVHGEWMEGERITDSDYLPLP